MNANYRIQIFLLLFIPIIVVSCHKGSNDRMIETGVRVIQNGTLLTSLDCYYSYNGQNNSQEIKMYGARGVMPTDTVKQLRTYSDIKRFFTLGNIGFGYFDSFSTGVAYKVSGITHVLEPFPFFAINQFVGSVNLTPSVYALRKLTGEGKSRDLSDPFNNGWQPDSWEWTDPGDSYGHMSTMKREDLQDIIITGSPGNNSNHKNYSNEDIFHCMLFISFPFVLLQKKR